MTLGCGKQRIYLDVIFVPEAGINLLGRDALSLLGCELKFSCNESIVNVLTEEQERNIDPIVWEQEGNRGVLDIPPLKVTLKEGTVPVKVKQYNIPIDLRRELKPVIEKLLADGLIEPTMSQYNSPILPVRKPDGSIRIVLDLRQINLLVANRHSIVGNPYTLLGRIPHSHKYFSVIDLKDAFWTCPLDEESRDIFAFEWADPDTHRNQQYRWCVLPQGFSESPNLFGQMLEQVLEGFCIPSGLQVLQYVDDLLLSGEKKVEVEKGTNALLNFLGRSGLRVSKRKLQYVELEVKYLGHLISQGSKRINPERVEGIITQPLPKTKKEVRKLLGLVGYCRLWIDDYTDKVRFLYDKLIEEEPWTVIWKDDDESKLKELKRSLMQAPVLSLPDLKKPFHLFVAVEDGIAKGVLAQTWAGKKKPIAFLSKLMDPVVRGWPLCVQAVAATALLVEESRKLTFGGALVVSSPHQVRTILMQKAHRWLTNARLLKYEVILLSQENLVLSTDRNLNPAEFLSGERQEWDSIEHNCVEVIDLQTKVREDLEDSPLEGGINLFIDGSSRVKGGRRINGYAVVNGDTSEILEAGKLPSEWSAQTCLKDYWRKLHRLIFKSMNIRVETGS
ncbi:retrovirus-related Pol polyprotein from transposon opus isoform X2 [Pantherophis guttatus]|uniref:ribonuclease H n=1 Tax=Pantherophis guttatus TaxID=94885 RepID=A0ABM3YU04_PANGU|nr:retrovirus-related Pol polyprotein from transposon opus isoform X2 [Pantherophis guttatus]